MIFIGSVIVIVILLSGLWFALSPLFRKIGYKAIKLKEKWEEKDSND